MISKFGQAKTEEVVRRRYPIGRSKKWEKSNWKAAGDDFDSLLPSRVKLRTILSRDRLAMNGGHTSVLMTAWWCSRTNKVRVDVRVKREEEDDDDSRKKKVCCYPDLARKRKAKLVGDRVGK